MYMATPRIILRLMLPKLRPSQEPRSPSTCSWQVSLLFGTPPCGLPCQYKWMTSKTFLGRLISPPEVQQGSRASASQEPLLTVQRLLRHKGLVSRLSLSSFSLSLSLSFSLLPTVVYRSTSWPTCRALFCPSFHWRLDWHGFWWTSS